jgi:hypothetical protein
MDFLDSHCFQCVPIKSHCVPIKFPKHVLQVLQYVPPTSSNNTSHYPVSFDLSSILVTYITSPKGGGCVIYPFWDCPKLDYIFCDGWSMMLITKETKLNTKGCRLINMSCIILYHGSHLYFYMFKKFNYALFMNFLCTSKVKV